VGEREGGENGKMWRQVLTRFPDPTDENQKTRGGDCFCLEKWKRGGDDCRNLARYLDLKEGKRKSTREKKSSSFLSKGTSGSQRRGTRLIEHEKRNYLILRRRGGGGINPGRKRKKETLSFGERGSGPVTRRQTVPTTEKGGVFLGCVWGGFVWVVCFFAVE